jgi:hypothetical protein
MCLEGNCTHFIKAVDTCMPAKIVSEIVASINIKFRADQSWPHWIWIWEDQVSLDRIGLISDKIY